MDDISGGENTISGDISGPAVQAGAIHGGVHVHSHPRVAAPRQLLSVPASFTDRADELAHLDRLLLGGPRQGPALVVLTGPGGVGKTALATRWISDHLDRFPDGQLHADLGAFGATGPTDTETVLRRLLRAFGVEADAVPPDLAGQAALYRSVTADKAVAVLADDADTAAQARPLLPASPDSVVIVTSRWRLGGLALDGARIVVVDPLDERAAWHLLSATAGRERVTVEPGSARQLVRFCAGLPIALCVVAARIATRPQQPLSRLVEALSDERRRIAELGVADEAVVQANFDLSCRELPEAVARAYRLLGLHPGPEFCAERTAAALDLSVGEAEKALDDLVTASLLTETGPERYRFHDLTRLHARQQAETRDSEDERACVLRRIIAWYLDAAAAADVAVLPLRPRLGPVYERLRGGAPRYASAVEALAWLEQELTNLVAAVRASAQWEWWDYTWQLCEALWGLFLYRKHYPDWIRTHEWGTEAARNCGDRRAEARLRVQLGYAHLDTGDHDQAHECFTVALNLAEEAGDAESEATAWEHLGLLARTTGRTEQALRRFQQALAIAETLEQPRLVALQLRRLSDVLCDLDRPEQALAPVRRAAALAAELGDSVLHMRAMTRLGTIQLRLDRLAEAQDSLRRAVDELAGSGADHYHAEALEALAELRTRTGETDAAETLLRRALALYERTGSPRTRRLRAQLAEMPSPSGWGTETSAPHNDP